VHCPACGGPTREDAYEGHYGRSVTIDVCDGCQGLWFDGAELLQLSPAGTVALFRAMTDLPASARPIAAAPRCPRCRAPLLDTSDLLQTTRFRYLRCPEGHGRYMTFFQFLRAKQFVRTPSAGELRSLREQVRQVNCSNCGAPVDLEREAACAHCRTPIAVIDPEQLGRTLAALDRAAAERQVVDPALPLTLLHERLRVERAFALEGCEWSRRGDTVTDLVGAGLALLRRVLR
jgi:Zn-finger nucleic acid-binding protein